MLKVKSHDHFIELFQRVFITHPVTMHHRAMLQQGNVPGEYDPALCQRHAYDLFIVKFFVIITIKAKHSQVLAKFPEVYVQNKAGDPQWLGP